MIIVLEQSNNYMKSIQEELDKMDWRGVLADVAANREYNNELMIEAEHDPDVERMYEEMERQVLGSKIPGNAKNNNIVINSNIPRVVDVS